MASINWLCLPKKSVRLRILALTVVKILYTSNDYINPTHFHLVAEVTLGIIFGDSLTAIIATLTEQTEGTRFNQYSRRLSRS